MKALPSFKTSLSSLDMTVTEKEPYALDNNNKAVDHKDEHI